MRRGNSETYYSNCFVEMLRAKFRNWNGTKLIVFLPSYAGSLHFAWSDGEKDYWFMNKVPTKGLLEALWHEGAIEQFKAGTLTRLKHIQIQDMRAES